MPYTSHAIVETMLQSHWDVEEVSRKRRFFVGFDTDVPLSQPPTPETFGLRSSMRRLVATTRALMSTVFETTARS